METTANRNTSTLLHLSALTQYFFPLGNLIFPTLIWSFKKDESEFVDHNGKQAVNFQLSILLYTLILGIVAVIIFIYRLLDQVSFNIDSGNDDWVINQFSMGQITGLVIIGIVAIGLAVLLKVAELILILYAAVKSNNGERFNFPLTINFLK